MISSPGGRGRAKVVLAGDTQQLQAVENGGGMSLLADALGYARLADRSGSAPPGNKPPACGSRGDTSVLAEYDQHGRVAAASRNR